MSNLTYSAVSSSIQGLLHKLQALLLQIQGVFKEKIIFKEYSRPVRTMFHAHKTLFRKQGFAGALNLVLKGRVFGTWKWPINMKKRKY